MESAHQRKRSLMPGTRRKRSVGAKCSMCSTCKTEAVKGVHACSVFIASTLGIFEAPFPSHPYISLSEHKDTLMKGRRKTTQTYDARSFAVVSPVSVRGGGGGGLPGTRKHYVNSHLVYGRK